MMMSDTEAEAPAATMRGRFALFGDTPMSYVLAYTSDLCDRCQGCGCGEQQEPIRAADIVKQMLNPRNLRDAVKAWRGQLSESGGDDGG